MQDIPLSVLLITLGICIVLSAFFSGSETALMSLNRYRLRHLARAKHPAAMRAQALLDRPDRLIGMILLGNNFVNILASSIATVIAMRLYGEAGIAIAAGVLTIIILLFAEVTPKTLGAMHPQPIALFSAYIYGPMIRLFYPIVWILSITANSMLKILGIHSDQTALQHLSREELRSVVNEAGALLPRRHKQMLLSILDLERVTVEDIMIPRNEITGIDLDKAWTDILQIITTTTHSRMPLFHGDITNVVGIVNIRNFLRPLTSGQLTKEDLIKVAREPYFVPQGTSLNAQLLSFQRQKRRLGLVVDEYGDICGLVTLEAILEEIVGEFTTSTTDAAPDILPSDDGSYLVLGGTSIRDINRQLHLHLPTEGPKTVNGLILEHMESIPQPGTSILIAGYPVEIMQTADNAVKVAKLRPRITNATKHNSPTV